MHIHSLAFIMQNINIQGGSFRALSDSYYITIRIRIVITSLSVFWVANRNVKCPIEKILDLFTHLQDKVTIRYGTI